MYRHETATGIGASVRRKEDLRFITGKGQYTDDISRPGETRALFVRSPHAHARIKKVDVDAARKMPGVVAVLTGAELATDKIGNLICGWMIHSKDGSPMKMSAASGASRRARPAMSAIRLRWWWRRRWRRRKDAAEKVAGRLRGAAGGDRSGQGASRSRRSTRSRRRTRSTSGISATPRPRTRRSSRPSTSPGSTSSTIAWCRTRWSRASRSANTTAARRISRSGTPRRIRTWRGSSSRPSSAWRPSTSSASSRPTSAAASARRFSSIPKRSSCLWASKKVGRPVKWTCDRSEAFLADAHGRDHVTHAEMAFGDDGKITGLKVKTIANLGAYMSTFSSSVPTYLYATLLSGQYDIPAIYCEVDAVYTNTVPVDAYRGAGRPEATFVVERLVEVGARELGIDPGDLRKKNFIKSFPHQTPVIMAYDAGDYHASLKKAMEIADVKGFGKRKRDSARAGQAPRPRLFDLHRGLRHRAVAGGRLARRGRRLVGIRRGAGQPDRLGRGADRLPQPRPGPRDHLRATRLGAARHPDRHRQHRPRRHRQGAVRHGHLRLALRRGRHVGDRQGARQGRGQGQEGRGLHAGGGRRRHRVQGRQVHRRRHRQVGRLGRGRRSTPMSRTSSPARSSSRA